MEPLPFRITKMRSTTMILKDTVRYISANARSLLQAYAMLALPFIVIGVIGAYLVTDSFMNIEKFFYYRDQLDEESFAFLCISFLTYVAGLGIYNRAVNKHMLLASTNDNNSASFDNIKKGFAYELKNFAFNFIILYAGYLIISRFIGFLFDDNHMVQSYSYSIIETIFGRSTKSVVLYALAVLVMPLCFYFCIASLFVCCRDHISATGALKKVWGYSKNNLKKVWFTSGQAAVFTLLGMYGVTLCFYPVYFIVAILDSDIPAFGVVAHMLLTAMKFLLVMYFQIAVILLFGSIEDEAEGLYIKSKIEKATK